jgi:transcriptional regulator with XRE-family HTH domain
MSRVGDAIRRRRKDDPRTIAVAYVLAEYAGISAQYLNDIELGRRLPSVGVLLRIANQFSDVDSAEWLWLLLMDLWGEPIAGVMRRHAALTPPPDPR